jgi:hypothetical protein
MPSGRPSSVGSSLASCRGRIFLNLDRFLLRPGFEFRVPQLVRIHLHENAGALLFVQVGAGHGAARIPLRTGVSGIFQTVLEGTGTAAETTTAFDPRRIAFTGDAFLVRLARMIDRIDHGPAISCRIGPVFALVAGIEKRALRLGLKKFSLKGRLFPKRLGFYDPFAGIVRLEWKDRPLVAARAGITAFSQQVTERGALPFASRILAGASRFACGFFLRILPSNV